MDEERKVKHTKMAEQIEEAITNPSSVGVKLKQDLLDIAYPPTVQSGGVYDLKASAQNNDRALQYDVILMSVGGICPLQAATKQPHITLLLVVYDLKASAQHNDTMVRYDVILMSIGGVCPLQAAIKQPPMISISCNLSLILVVCCCQADV